MSLIVDASVAIKWGVAEPDAEEARALLARKGLIAPDLIVAEIANILWKKEMRGELAPGQRAISLQICIGGIDEFVAAKDLALRALELSVELRHPAYDCFYLALAEAKGDEFVTADARLLSRLEQSGWAGQVRAL